MYDSFQAAYELRARQFEGCATALEIFDPKPAVQLVGPSEIFLFKVTGRNDDWKVHLEQLPGQGCQNRARITAVVRNLVQPRTLQ